MLVYYFVPFIVSNRYLLFWVSNGHNSVTVQNWTHVYMKFCDHKDLGNHLLQLCPKVVKHPVYTCIVRNPIMIREMVAVICNETVCQVRFPVALQHLHCPLLSLPLRRKIGWGYPVKVVRGTSTHTAWLWRSHTNRKNCTCTEKTANATVCTYMQKSIDV